MKSITVKITSKYREYDVAHEVMLDDVIEGFKYVNDFDFELVEEEYNGIKCPVCGSEKTYQTQAIHCNHCAVTTEI